MKSVSPRVAPGAGAGCAGGFLMGFLGGLVGWVGSAGGSKLDRNEPICASRWLRALDIE
ncbi:MAG: hypothetical protein ACK46X_05275 [Candidatus Sericytochromatia bacterium]